MTSAPRFYHPDAESALLAAKKACRRFPGRWYGRASSRADAAEFHVYEGIKVVESHIYMRNELAEAKERLRELPRASAITAAGSDEMDRPLRLPGHETLHRHCREDQGQCHEAL